MTTQLRTAAIAGAIAITCLAAVWWRAAEQAVAAIQNDAAVSASEARLWVLRLHPGDDLVESIMGLARKHSIEAGAIVTCVGSVDRARLRYANQSKYESLDSKGRHFEIVSLVGTFSTSSHHLHLALANEEGDVFGGHADSGNKIYTTAEVVVAEGLAWAFHRERDPHTTYLELSPGPRKSVSRFSLVGDNALQYVYGSLPRSTCRGRRPPSS
jgi:predicted DNA-binding protein with PD1-like motif